MTRSMVSAERTIECGCDRLEPSVEERHSIAFIALATSLSLATLLFGPIPLSNDIQIVLLTAAVLLIGLPHGAFDAFVARKSLLWRDFSGFVLFHVAYVAMAACVVALWLVAPLTALVLFLALSAYHFSGDWRSRMSVVERVVVGLTLLSIPALSHTNEVAQIFQTLAGENGRQVSEMMALLAVVLLPSTILIILRHVKSDCVLSAEVTSVCALAYFLPPATFFLVYFCLLHSPKHVIHAVNAQIGISRSGWLVVGGYTILAAVLTLPLGYFASTVQLSQFLTAQIFIGLAALSLPHMVLVEFAHHRNVLATRERCRWSAGRTIRTTR